eukprot:9477138-Pyramimonas_sp.AAC.1
MSSGPCYEGPCSDTADVNVVLNSCLTPEATRAGRGTGRGPRAAWTLSEHAWDGSQSGVDVGDVVLDEVLVVHDLGHWPWQLGGCPDGPSSH